MSEVTHTAENARREAHRGGNNVPVDRLSAVAAGFDELTMELIIPNPPSVSMLGSKDIPDFIDDDSSASDGTARSNSGSRLSR